MRSLVLLLCFPLIAHAQIYKWVDEKGRVQYGERPPPNAKPVPLKPEAIPGPVKPPAAEDLKQKEMDSKRRQIEEAQARDKALADAEVRRRDCALARTRLEQLERNPRPFRNVGGERVYYSEAEREAELSSRRVAVKRACD
ncbi:MAG: DUF4124 domain-containing protein [Betaproteobacteria bacterium]